MLTFSHPFSRRTELEQAHMDYAHTPKRRNIASTSSVFFSSHSRAETHPRCTKPRPDTRTRPCATHRPCSFLLLAHVSLSAQRLLLWFVSSRLLRLVSPSLSPFCEATFPFLLLHPNPTLPSKRFSPPTFALSHTQPTPLLNCSIPPYETNPGIRRAYEAEYTFSSTHAIARYYTSLHV